MCEVPVRVSGTDGVPQQGEHDATSYRRTIGISNPNRNGYIKRFSLDDAGTVVSLFCADKRVPIMLNIENLTIGKFVVRHRLAERDVVGDHSEL